MTASLATVLAIGSLVGGGICLCMAAVAWQYRTMTAALPFVGVLIAAAAWSFANAGLLLAPTANGAYVAERVVRASSAHVAPTWFVFVLAFTGREEWVSVRNLAVLWLVPVAYVLASLAAPFHSLASSPADAVLLTTNGITAYVVPGEFVYDAHLLFAFLTILLGIGILLRFVVDSRGIFRKQTIAIVVGTTVPTVVVGVADLGVLPHPGLDPTPIAFAGTTLLVAWALVRYDLLSVTPLAGDVLVDELPDPVFVLDGQDTVVDHNPAAQAAFGVDRPTGEPIDSVAPGLLEHVESRTMFCEPDDGTEGGQSRYYDPNVTEIEDQYGNERRRLLVLRDVTGQQRRQQRLEALQEATRQFLGASTDEEIAEIGVEYADEVLDTHGTAVFLADDSTDELHPVAMTDTIAGIFEHARPPPEPMASSIGTAFETDESDRLELPGPVGAGTEQALSVPLGDHGVLWIGTNDRDTFAPDDEGFATILARTTQVALTRVERESALRRSRSSVERRSEQIAFFNGVLRHTLRNALLVIQGRADHLRGEVAESEQRHLDTIVGWCDDLADLSEEIRAVNDTVTATESERLDTVDLSQMLFDSVRSFEREHEGVTFDVDVDPDLRIQANELATRAIDSILENAVIHNDRADPHIEVWSVRAADRVQVHVADDGPGMDDDMKSIVFERDLSTSETASGFGLYFVSVLMNLYGGTVRFEDNHPRGTVAVLEFQAASDGAADPVDGTAQDVETT